MPKLGRNGIITLALCLPEILSTGSLALMDLVVEKGLLPEWAAQLPLVGWIYFAVPLPAFVVAGYVGPVLLLFAPPFVVRAWRDQGASREARWIPGAILPLAVAAFVFFDRVVVWWKLSFLP